MQETNPVSISDSGAAAVTPHAGTSPPWNRATRRAVAIIMAALLLFLLWRFQGLVAQIIIGALMAYLLNPLIRFLTERTPLKRSRVTVLVYLALVLLLLGGLALLGVAVYNEVSDLLGRMPRLIDDAARSIATLTNNPNTAITLGPYTLSMSDIDWSTVDDQIFGLVNPALRSTPAAAGQVASSTLNLLGWIVMTLIISLYIALDLPRTGENLNQIMHQSGYHADYERLRNELIKIGNAYLRGQALLGLAVGVMTGVLLGLLGVRNALALGILSGVLELVPYFGPIISAIIAVLVAAFQPENYLGLGQFQFALATLAVMILVQQLENNFLVPRIVGGALNLQPLAVIIAVVVGYGLAGIWGSILAAPVAAAIKLIGGYMWRKLLGLPPFPPDDAHWMRGPGLLGRTLARIRRRGHRAVVEVQEDIGPPGEPPPAVRA